LEIGFFTDRGDGRCRVSSIHVSFEDRADLPPGVDVRGWWPMPEVTVEELIGRLNDEGVRGREFKTYRDFGPSASSYRVYGYGGRITFSEGRLHSLHWRASRPVTRQVTMSFPEETFNVIRRLARESRLSVSDLCERWIGERVARAAEVKSL